MSIGRKFVTFAALVGVTVIGGGFATAADNDSQNVQFDVASVRTITAPTDVDYTSETLSRYDTVTGISGGNLRYETDFVGDSIKAEITAGVTDATLKVTAGTPTCASCDVAATAVGTSAGQTTLSGTAADVITIVSEVFDADGDGASSALSYDITTAGTAAGNNQYFTVKYTIY